MSNVTIAAIIMVSVIAITLFFSFPIGLSIGLGAVAAIVFGVLLQSFGNVSLVLTLL